jgi:hypothetical protein
MEHIGLDLSRHEGTIQAREGYWRLENAIDDVRLEVLNLFFPLI